MRAYYDRRTTEYDDWWLGSGLFADRDRPGWHEEAAMVEVASARLPGARIVQGGAVLLPFRDGEFDPVFTGHFDGHLLAGERERFLAEVRACRG
jgi:methyltransferase family protein